MNWNFVKLKKFLFLERVTKMVKIYYNRLQKKINQKNIILFFVLNMLCIWLINNPTITIITIITIIIIKIEKKCWLMYQLLLIFYFYIKY